jgi:hypothetical protein
MWAGVGRRAFRIGPFTAGEGAERIENCRLLPSKEYGHRFFERLNVRRRGCRISQRFSHGGGVVLFLARGWGSTYTFKVKLRHRSAHGRETDEAPGARNRRLTAAYTVGEPSPFFVWRIRRLKLSSRLCTASRRPSHAGAVRPSSNASFKVHEQSPAAVFRRS